MTTDTQNDVRRYFYRSLHPSTRHRNRVSVYFVECFEDSVLVARIESLGLVPAATGERELAVQRRDRRLIVDGRWQPTMSHHHARIRLARLPDVK